MALLKTDLHYVDKVGKKALVDHYLHREHKTEIVSGMEAEPFHPLFPHSTLRPNDVLK